MAKKMSRLEAAQKKTEEAVKRTNKKIDELGQHTNILFSALTLIQSLFDEIRNVPQEEVLKYEKLKKIRVDWKQQAEKIETDYKKAEVQAAGQGAAGVSAGVAVAALGPTAAMGIATTFGVASTGTAISTLSGAAATNAALAWLGGGALAAGGGGMAAGNALLALAGPVGWTIAGVAVAVSGFMFFKTKNDKERLENIYTLISERDTKSYELSIVELEERIKRIVDETKILSDAITKVKTFGIDYNKMTINQQYELGTYVHLMEAATMLLINPIQGLQPKYTEKDLKKYCESENDWAKKYYMEHKIMMVTLANLLYKIKLDTKDKELLAKSLKKNKKFLESIKMNKSSFSEADITFVQAALRYKYKYGTN